MRPKLRKKYVCTACRRKFGTSNAAWTHVAFTHDQVVQANVEILCCDCKTLFPTETDLEKHVDEVHTAPPVIAEEDLSSANERSLGLEELNLSSQNETLIVTNESPSPEKAPEENIEENTKALTQCKSFKLHCSLCKKKFKSENVLWTHVTFKHGNKSQNFMPQFSCDSCKSIFDSLEEFKEHSSSSFLSEPRKIVHKSSDLHHCKSSEHCSGVLNVDKSIEHIDSSSVSCCDAKEKTTSGRSDETDDVHLNLNACNQVEALNHPCVPKNEILANNADVSREPTELLNSSDELIAVNPEFSTEYDSQADNQSSESSSIESHLDNHIENNLAIDGEQDCGSTTPEIASSHSSNTVILAQNIEEDERMIVTEEDEESEDEYEGKFSSLCHLLNKYLRTGFRLVIFAFGQLYIGTEILFLIPYDKIINNMLAMKVNFLHYVIF